MAAVEEEDPEQLRAAQILVNLRHRKLRKRPEWVPMQSSGDASSSARTVAAALSSSLTGAVVAGVPERWPKAKRSGSRGETSKTLPGHAAAAAKGSGAPWSSEQERCAEMPAASAQRRPVVAALCYAAVAGSGSGSGPSLTSVAAAKEPMKTPSPKSPLDYGADGSGAPSSADDAAPARSHAKRKGTGAPGSVGGGDDEGCSTPAKRVPVAEEEKPMPISVEPSESQTRASSGKGAPHPFDLNLPCTLDEDDDGCPDTS